MTSQRQRRVVEERARGRGGARMPVASFLPARLLAFGLTLLLDLLQLVLSQCHILLPAKLTTKKTHLALQTSIQHSKWRTESKGKSTKSELVLVSGSYYSRCCFSKWRRDSRIYLAKQQPEREIQNVRSDTLHVGCGPYKVAGFLSQFSLNFHGTVIKAYNKYEQDCP